MRCPKCAFEQPHGRECMRCGVIFAKVTSSRAPAAGALAPSTLPERPRESPATTAQPGVVPQSHTSRAAPEAAKASPPSQATGAAAARGQIAKLARRANARPRRRRTRRRALILRELAIMTSAGTALDEALETLAQALRGGDGRALRAAAKLLRAGHPLSDALSRGAGLEAVEVALLVTAERTGRLPELLAQLADRAEALEEVSGKVVTSLAWPIMTLVMAALMMPIPALVKSGVGAYLAQSAAWLSGLAGAGLFVVVGVPTILRVPAIRDLVLMVVDPLPGIGRFTRTRRMSLLFGALGPALDCGLPLAEALDLAAGATGERRVRVIMARIAPSLAAGGDLALLLAPIPGMDSACRARIASGARSGRLADACLRLATEQGRAYRQSVEWMGAAVRLSLTLLITLVVGASVMDQMMELMSNPLSMVPGPEGRELERELFKVLPSLRP